MNIFTININKFPIIANTPNNTANAYNTSPNGSLVLLILF